MKRGEGFGGGGCPNLWPCKCSTAASVWRDHLVTWHRPNMRWSPSMKLDEASITPCSRRQTSTSPVSLESERRHALRCRTRTTKKRRHALAMSKYEWQGLHGSFNRILSSGLMTASPPVSSDAGSRRGRGIGRLHAHHTHFIGQTNFFVFSPMSAHGR